MTVKRLNADFFFTPQRDFYCLSRHLDKLMAPSFHCHEYYEVEIITAGTAADETNGGTYVLHSGDFMILGPDDSHCIQGCDENGAELINIAVSVSLMEEILAFLEWDRETFRLPLRGRLPQKLISQLEIQVNALIGPVKDISGERSVVKQWMTTCFLCCHLPEKPEQDAKLPAWLQQLMNEMKTPEGLSGGIEYLKAHTDRSYPHVCRCFQKYLGQTPVEWINEHRLVNSAHLLLRTDKTVLEISLECGFHNLSHFNHLFKSYYGIAPTTLRAMV